MMSVGVGWRNALAFGKAERPIFRHIRVDARVTKYIVGASASSELGPPVAAKQNPATKIYLAHR
jgi:hypothetical protein